MSSSVSPSESLSLELLDAIEAGDEAKASALIEQGADVNFVDPATNSSCFSVAFDNLSMVKLLLAKGADPNLPGGGGELPLFHVIGTGNVEIVNALIDGGADVNARTGMLGDTLVNAAFLEDDIEVLKHLIQRGADPNVGRWEGRENLWDFAKMKGVSKQQLAESIGYDFNESSWGEWLRKAIRLR